MMSTEEGSRLYILTISALAKKSGEEEGGEEEEERTLIHDSPPNYTRVRSNA